MTGPMPSPVAPHRVPLLKMPSRAAVLLSYREFPANAGEVSRARRFTRESLSHHPGFEADDACLLVSELATNVIVHTHSPRFALTLLLTSDHRLRAEITDDGRSDSIPRLDPTHTERPNGRGLLLVATVAERWGTQAPSVLGGTLVWFDMPPTLQAKTA